MSNKRLPKPKGYEEMSLPHLVDKPWGRETWLELWKDPKTGRGYCLKLIFLKANEISSLQYHQRKVETQYIVDGRAEVSLENEKGSLERRTIGKGEFFTVINGRKHRVKALTDLTLLEVSTPEVEDIVRINDKYNRK
jgi:mannose-6-phosphate isomerase-like protein (cupin superfamily)